MRCVRSVSSARPRVAPLGSVGGACGAQYGARLVALLQRCSVAPASPAEGSQYAPLVKRDVAEFHDGLWLSLEI